MEKSESSRGRKILIREPGGMKSSRDALWSLVARTKLARFSSSILTDNSHVPVKFQETSEKAPPGENAEAQYIYTIT